MGSVYRHFIKELFVFSNKSPLWKLLKSVSNKLMIHSTVHNVRLHNVGKSAKQHNTNCNSKRITCFRLLRISLITKSTFKHKSLDKLDIKIKRHSSV